MAKKLKKAVMAGLAAYAGAKMLKSKRAAAALAGVPEGKELITKKPFKHDLEAISPRKPDHLGDKGGSMDHMVPKKWWQFWKKHGGSITTAKLGRMIKASQGTYAREDESLGMRLGKGKGTAKERDMSYGDWGKRKHDWAKSGKMIKARYGTEVRTDGSNPHVPKGGTAYVKTKLNGTLKVKTF
jgi:hypothetical protein